MPADQRPWDDAYVRGVARSVETPLPEAIRYLLIAMHACGGWPDNAELAQARAAYGV
jgi:hypothetical protein